VLIIFGKKINEFKKVRFALTYIFGIGFSNAHKLCNFLNIPQTIKIFELTEIQKMEISTFIKKNFIVEARLKKNIQNNVKTFIAINSIRGFRHRVKLPVRGQRTRSNAQT
jgi:small subunit ribosomal protein S13